MESTNTNVIDYDLNLDRNCSTSFLESDQGLRLRCLDFVTRRSPYTSPVYQMIEAEMLLQYLKTGKIPLKSNRNAEQFADELLSRSLDQLIEERKNSNESKDSSNPIPDDFGNLSSSIKAFVRKLGFKRGK
jgi:hypothetical protein